jgi:hypothetical protein
MSSEEDGGSGGDTSPQMYASQPHGQITVYVSEPGNYAPACFSAMSPIMGSLNICP